MRYLGIDYGSKRIGLAVSSEGIAFPRGVIPNDAGVLGAISEIIKKERISAIIVGDTRSFGGLENPVTKEAEEFSENLRDETGLDVQLVSEAGSTVEAGLHAPKDTKHDDAAAAFILQRYLDMRAPSVDSDHA